MTNEQRQDREGLMISLLVLDEGLQLRPYRCPAGKLTIGIGRNLETTGISKAEAMLLLSNDLVRIRAELNQYCWPWWRSLSEVRQAVLTMMAFNLGVHGLSRFRKMLAALAVGDWAVAANQMRASLWYSQVPIRAERLRRMVLENQWPVVQKPH